MMRKLFSRLLIGLCFALPFGIIASATVHAQTQDEEPVSDECVGCHEITQSHWADSAHGTSYDDPVFQNAWQDEGSPDECLACHTTGFDPATGNFQTDSVSCTTCHNPVPTDHPEDIMPTDVSSRMCGTCHLESHAEWETSGHGKEDLACVRCHNAHTTEIRADGVQELCQSCHNDATQYYNETAHAAQGLLCSDCHLRVSDETLGEGHAKREHSFTVDLDTCSSCHSDDMHTAMSGLTMPASDTEEVKVTQPVISKASMPEIQSEPDPVGPMGFAVLASLVGMGFGIVVAPWLTKWSRRSDDEGKKDE